MKYSKLVSFLATGFYLGKSPKAPGTFGTLGGIPVWYILSRLTPMASIALTLAIVALAILIADIYEKEHGDHDRQEIVIDEIAGFLVTMALIPFDWRWMILGFVLFRILDILKPFPISYLDQKVKGGLGVVVDDVAAGMIANIILQILFSFGIL